MHESGVEIVVLLQFFYTSKRYYGYLKTLHEKLPLHHAFDICQRCQRPYLTIPLITFDAS